MTGELGIIRAFAGSPVEMRAYPSAIKVDDEYSAGITLTRNETDVAVLYFNEHGIMLRDTVAAQSNKVAYATPPQVFDVPLADNWTTQQTSTYFKTQEGIVVARIAIKSTAEYTSGGLLFTLPEGFRPSENAEFPCAIKKANLQASSIYLQTSGAASENHSGGESFPIGTELCALAIFIAAS